MRAGTIASRPGVFKGTFTATDLMREELPPVRWAVPGILPEGLSLLAGKPKLGKSWLALGLAVAKASGGLVLGKIPVDRGEVLYLALEDNRRRLQNRLKKVLDGDPPPEGLHIATEWARVDEGGADDLDDWLAVHPDAGLVVVDILKVVRPSVSGNRGIYDADYEALQSMQKLAGTHGVSILVVHHTRKMSASDPVDEVSGSTGLSGGADGIMFLKRDRGKADAYLHVTGREIDNEAELALRWNATQASWTLAGDAEEYRLSQERRGVLETLGGAGGGMSPKELAEAFGKSVGSVKVLLGEMVKAGQVSNPSYGKYDLPANSPYSAYPAYSSNGGGGKSKDGKGSKRDMGGASLTCVHGLDGGGGWVADGPMRRNKAGRRAVCGGGWAGTEPLLPARPRALGGAQAQRPKGRADEGVRGGAGLPEKAAEGPRRRGAGRHRGPGGRRGSQPNTEHDHQGHRAGAQGTGARGARRAPGGYGGSVEGTEDRVSKDGLRRHYDRLTAEERFRLDVLAMARGDEQESERLVSSCPKFTYDMNDRAFTRRWLGVLDMTLRVYLEIAGHLDRVAIMGVMREMLPFQDRYARERMRDAFVEGHRAGVRQAWDAAKGKGKGPALEWPHERIDEVKVDELAQLGASIMLEILDGLERKEAGHALTLWRGFGAFCDGTLGVDAGKVLRVVLEAGASRVDKLEALAERLELEPDAEIVEEIREGLAEAWCTVLGRGGG